jgi:hypothetical protein
MPTYEFVLRTDARAASESMAENFRRHVLAGEPLSAPVGGPAQVGIRCLVCGLTSWNPHDVRERYCGHCHRFHEDAWLT